MLYPEFKHLTKEKLRKRIRLLFIFVFVSLAIALTAFVLFITDYKGNWSLLLVGLTYALFPFNFLQRRRRMQKELADREQRSELKAEPA